MVDEKYNGWTNWDTWATGLWLDNEQNLYNKKVAILKAGDKYASKGRYDKNRLKAALIRVYKEAANAGRKSGDEINNKKVNWDELVESAVSDWNLDKQNR